MKALSKIGAAAGFAVLALGFSSPASAAPASPIAIKQALGDMPSNVIDVRRGGGQRWVGRGGGRGWGGRGWAGRGGWRGGPRYGWRGGWRGGPRYGWRGNRNWGPGWGWGVGGLALGAAIASAPYYYNDGCGYVNTRQWINGRRVWVRQYQCW